MAPNSKKHFTLCTCSSKQLDDLGQELWILPEYLTEHQEAGKNVKAVKFTRLIADAETNSFRLIINSGTMREEAKTLVPLFPICLVSLS